MEGFLMGDAERFDDQRWRARLLFEILGDIIIF
jgi:hypothetical protein